MLPTKSFAALCALGLVAPALPAAEPESPPAGLVASDAPAPARGSLLGLVVVDSADEIVADGRPGVRGVDVALAGAFADPALVGRLNALIGRPLNTELLPSVREAVGAHYADNRALLVRFVLPVQEVKDGVLQILLVRARIGRVKVEGEKWFSKERYLDAFALTPGEELDLARADAGLDRVNANSFRRATAELEPGEELGTTDITLRARDRVPLGLTVGYSDSGTMSSGEDRVNAGVTWGDAFKRGDVFGYGFGATPGSDVLRSHSANYRANLLDGRAFTAALSYAEVNSELVPPFDQTGKSSSVMLRYEMPLPAWGKVSQNLAFAVDYKRSDSNLLFSSLPVFGSITEVLQGVIDYNASLADKFGATSFGAALTLSPGDMTSKNEDSDFQAQRADASARYAYLVLSAGRRTQLPAKFALTNSARFQVATTNLLGSEQLGLGGAYSARGYEEGEVYADEGLLLRNELTLPRWTFGGGRAAGAVLPLVFWDYGYGTIRDPLPGERDSFSLSSVGAGVRFSFSRHLSASFDYGWQLIETGLNARNRSSRGHLSVSAAW